MTHEVSGVLLVPGVAGFTSARVRRGACGFSGAEVVVAAAAMLVRVLYVPFL